MTIIGKVESLWRYPVKGVVLPPNFGSGALAALQMRADLSYLHNGFGGGGCSDGRGGVGLGGCGGGGSGGRGGVG
jgi:hypothetical protein